MRNNYNHCRRLGLDERLNEKIGIELKMKRKSTGMSQEELARKLKTTQATISRIERAVDNITMTKVIKYVNALGIQIVIKFPVNGEEKIFEDGIDSSQDIYYQTTFKNELFRIGSNYAGIMDEGEKQVLPDLVRSLSGSMESLFDKARTHLTNLADDEARPQNDTGASGQGLKSVRELCLYGGKCPKISILAFYPKIWYSFLN